MAISIDSTTNLQEVHDAETDTGWSFSGITKTSTSSASREGTNCVGGQVANASFGYAWYTISSVNMQTAGNERVYIWVNSVGPGTTAQKGWMVHIGDGTHARAYVVGGSDDVPFSVKGWYCLMLDTANLPAAYEQTDGTDPPDLTAITQFGFGIYNTVAPSGNALNVFCDVVRYGSGIIVTTDTSTVISLADIAAEDFSSADGNAYGIIREIQPGVYGVQGDIIFGDTGTSDIELEDTDAVVIFEDRVRGTGTNTNFQFSGVHNASGTFSVELGVAVSSGDTESGRSGVTFISANPADQPIDIDFSDSDIEDVFLYGCTFTNLRGGTIAFSADATNGISHHLSGCSFSGCSQVAAGVVDIRNTLFAATADLDSALMWNESIDIKNCNFIGNTIGAAIEHPDTGPTYNYYGLKFTGNTYDGLNSSGADLTVELTDSDASLDEGANTITYTSAVTVTLTGIVDNSELTITKRGTAIDTGSDGASTAGSRNFVTTNAWTVDAYQGFLLEITSGADAGRYYCYGNSATTLYLDAELDNTASSLTWELYDENDDTIEKHVENTSGNEDWSYTTGAGDEVDIMINHIDYQDYVLENYPKPSSSTSLPISQIKDVNYYNP